MVAGTFARTALIKSIYETGMNLTGKSRTTLTNSALMNHVSTDVCLSLLTCEVYSNLPRYRSAE